MSINQLCSGQDNAPIYIEMMQSSKKKNHKQIHIITTNFDQLKKAQDEPIIHQFQTSFNYNQSEDAKFIISNLKVKDQFSFLDYIAGGCNIQLLVALDFTKSNENSSSAQSLHIFDSQKPNDYISAIKSVGNVLQYYDSDKKIPFYGFGAKLNPFQDSVSHCFALNGNIFEPEVDGIEGMTKAYQNTLQWITFHGPTFFQNIIKMAVDYASQIISQQNQQYFILLILTDGIINDMERTRDQIVKASELPLSIIIIGIGNEDFTLMHQLDADDTPIYSKKYQKKMERDIVQFVPFNQYRGDSNLLAQQVLEEIPEQFLDYFQKHKIKPNNTRKFKSKQNLVEKQTLKQQKINSLMKEEFILNFTKKGYNRKKLEKLVLQGIPTIEYDIVKQIVKHNQVPYISIKDIFELKRISQSQELLQQQQKQVFNEIMLYQRIKIDEYPKEITKAQNISIKKEQDKTIQPIQANESSKMQEKTQLKPILKKQSQYIQENTEEQLNQPFQHCKLCYNNKIDIVLLECGHEIICHSCVEKCNKVCPVCKCIITKWIKTYC